MSEIQAELPEGWKWAKLKDVIQSSQTGFASSERTEDGVVQLRMNNVTTKGDFDWSSYIRVPASVDQREKYSLEPDDVLFNNTNSVELVGKSVLFDRYEEAVVYSNHFTRLRTNPDVLAPKLLAFWLQSKWSEGFFAQICNRWIGQAGINQSKLLALELPIPPLEQQAYICNVLGSQMAKVDKARAAIEAQLEAINALPASLLRQAFSGELTRQLSPKKHL